MRFGHCDCHIHDAIHPLFSPKVARIMHMYATEMLSWDCLFLSKKEVLCTEVDLINSVTFL